MLTRKDAPHKGRQFVVRFVFHKLKQRINGSGNLWKLQLYMGVLCQYTCT